MNDYNRGALSALAWVKEIIVNSGEKDSRSKQTEEVFESIRIAQNELLTGWSYDFGIQVGIAPTERIEA